MVVEDEFSFFAPGRPKVANATVSLRRPGGAPQVLKTDENGKNGSCVCGTHVRFPGTVVFKNVREGSYTLFSQALKHSNDRRVVVVESTPQAIRVFLHRSVVSYVWTVTPTTFQEKYEFKLETGE